MRLALAYDTHFGVCACAGRALLFGSSYDENNLLPCPRRCVGDIGDEDDVHSLMMTIVMILMLMMMTMMFMMHDARFALNAKTETRDHNVRQNLEVTLLVSE